jgi:hypothetical protein
MLKDELQLLRGLVNTLLGAVGGHLITGYPPDLATLLAAECPRIKKMWSGLLFSRATDNVIKRYVGFQQQILLDLSDELYKAISSNTPVAAQGDDEAMMTYSQLLLEALLGLNHFLVHYFNSYVNKQLNLPAAAIPEARKGISEIARRFTVDFQNVTLDGQLKGCILDYLNDIGLADSTLPLTYRSREYLLSFVESLSVAVSSSENDGDLTATVAETLFYLNFNHHAFGQWHREDIAGKKMGVGKPDQLDVLRKQMLLLKTMPVVLTRSYDPAILPINILLENWLNAMIKEEKGPLGKDPPDKIELKLTVAQLALLIRLLYEEGVFAMKNIAGLLRFFSGHFMSKKQEHISYGSMNKLYYSGDQFTGYAVRALLLKMVAKINKMFFPA